MRELGEATRAEHVLGEPVRDGLDPARDAVEAGVTDVADGRVWPHHTWPPLALTWQPASEGAPSSARRTIPKWPLSQLSLSI